MSLGDRFWDSWLADYAATVREMLAGEALASACDLGCGDGSFIRTLVPRETQLHGVENHAAKARAAGEAGLDVLTHDLNTPLPYETASFDAVFSHFVIEHIPDVDTHLSEMRRILKPGGVAVVGTENLASWHNVMALVFGQQPFTMTIALSATRRLGNVFQPGRFGTLGEDESPHHRVFAYQGLQDMLTAHGFQTERMAGAGYFPLAGPVGRALGRFDRRHAALILAKARAPKAS